MNKKKNNMRMVNTVVDAVHIGICIAIIIITFFILLKPVKNIVYCPVVFFLAAVLNLTNSYVKFKYRRITRGISTSGIITLVIGIACTIIAIISAVSIY